MPADPPFLRFDAMGILHAGPSCDCSYAAADSRVADETERYLISLLARIHRDGGHRTHEAGLTQSVADAHERIAAAYTRIAELEAPGECRSIHKLTAKVAEKDAEIATLRTFAAACQRAHATPGCENEPLRIDSLPLLAERVARTADRREALGGEIEVARSRIAQAFHALGPAWKQCHVDAAAEIAATLTARAEKAERESECARQNSRIDLGTLALWQRTLGATVGAMHEDGEPDRTPCLDDVTEGIDRLVADARRKALEAAAEALHKAADDADALHWSFGSVRLVKAHELLGAEKIVRSLIPPAEGQSQCYTYEAVEVAPITPGLAPHQQRVVNERAELDTRTEALAAFLPTPICVGLAVEEQHRLRFQLAHMRAYRSILDERIAAF